MVDRIRLVAKDTSIMIAESSLACFSFRAMGLWMIIYFQGFDLGLKRRRALSYILTMLKR